jgi:hypothetical protein
MKVVMDKVVNCKLSAEGKYIEKVKKMIIQSNEKILC